MAEIKRRGPGQYRVRIRRAGHPAQSATFPTRQLAERWAREIETAMAAGKFSSALEAQRTTLGEALDRYLREVTPGKRDNGQEEGRIDRLKATPLATMTLAAVRGADLADYRDARMAGCTFEDFRDARARKVPLEDVRTRRPVKANTVRLDLAIISHLYTVAASEWGMEDLANPLTKVRKPSAPNGRDRRLHRAAEGQEAEEVTLMRVAEPALRPMMVLAIETAMRRGELARLRWEHVDMGRRVAHLPRTKNGAARDVPLSARATATLARLKQGPRRLDGYVFDVPKVAAEYMTQAFRRATKAAGIKGLTFHDLRHEATSRLFERGLGIAEVAAITGHKTLAMLKRYTHLRADDLVLRLDQLAAAQADAVAGAPAAAPRASRPAPVLVKFKRRAGADRGLQNPARAATQPAERPRRCTGNPQG